MNTKIDENFNNENSKYFHNLDLSDLYSKIDNIMENFFNETNITNNINNDNFNLSDDSYFFDFKLLFNNQPILYSFSENLNFYSFKIVYYLYNTFFFQDHTNIINKIYIKNVSITEHNNLFVSFILNQMYFLFSFSFPVFDMFFNHYINSSEFSNVFINNPEIYLIYKNYIFYYFNNFFTNTYVSLNLLTLNEAYLISSIMIFQFFFIYILILFFLILYFNYYGNYNTENNIIDQDYLIYNMIIESEEEIGSFDDILLTSVILVFIFFWFFWINSILSFLILPSLTTSIILLPLLFFLIFCIPVSLLYDYGINFISYLNGVGKSSLLTIELLFDFIAVSIFFLRLVVQNVRLVFMLFTFFELHELVLNYQNNRNFIILNEFFSDAWEYFKNVIKQSNFWLFFNVIKNLLNWLYELFHTYFMIIFQFIAFFAMVFWLFLFLYTMFSSEKHESFFNKKKIEYKLKNEKKIVFKK